eukprot:1057995-Prorocentrum_minimum.AAC.3
MGKLEGQGGDRMKVRPPNEPPTSPRNVHHSTGTPDDTHRNDQRIRKSVSSDELAGYSHDGPIRRRKRGDILMTDQSDAGSVGIFS